jgi:hypothetical protein
MSKILRLCRGVVSSMPSDRTLEKVQIALPRKSVNPAIDALRRSVSFGPVEEVVHQKVNVGFGHDARADRPPAVLEEPGQLLGPWAL